MAGWLTAGFFICLKTYFDASEWLFECWITAHVNKVTQFTERAQHFFSPLDTCPSYIYYTYDNHVDYSCPVPRHPPQQGM